jgi:hypothetical protein
LNNKICLQKMAALLERLVVERLADKLNLKKLA